MINSVGVCVCVCACVRVCDRWKDYYFLLTHLYLDHYLMLCAFDSYIIFLCFYDDYDYYFYDDYDYFYLI